MFLSDFSIKRPMVVVAVTLAMMIFGYFAMTNLKTNQFPDVQPPVLVMTIPYPGASPETVEREILNRVEDSMATITGMRELRSYARDSNAVIVAIFEFDKDLIEASQEMRDAVAVVRDKLPTEMKEPFLRREDSGNLIKRNGAFSPEIISVDGESDAHPTEDQISFSTL